MENTDPYNHKFGNAKINKKENPLKWINTYILNVKAFLNGVFHRVVLGILILI